ncbi:hypothetical protein [Burkholderia stagnalis]
MPLDPRLAAWLDQLPAAAAPASLADLRAATDAGLTPGARRVFDVAGERITQCFRR